MDDVNSINSLLNIDLKKNIEEPSILDTISDKFGNVISGVSSAIIPQIADVSEFGSLIDKQIYWQMQMQTYSAESNIEKSRHEVLMAPIRNFRIN